MTKAGEGGFAVRLEEAQAPGPSPHAPSLCGYETQQRLLQWGLQSGLSVLKLRFVKAFKKGLADEFLVDVFNHSAVKELCGQPSQAHCDGVVYKERPCRVTHLGFFDRIVNDARIVGENGQIRRCLDEEYDGKFVGDELQKMLVDQGSERREVYEADEQQEVAFELLRVLVAGGAMVQTSESVHDYLEVFKGLYRDLVAVAKDRASGDVKVVSAAYEVTSLKGSMELLPSNAQPAHSRCLVLVDPLRKAATVLLFAHDQLW